LVYRTASALLTARLFHAGTAVTLIQSFGNNAARREDFKQFCESLQAREAAAGLYSVKTSKAPALFLAWCQGDPRFLNVDLPRAI
jgi:hypothetical protein